jgi:CRP/FNR family cyclic AMP-dependent transcriptional regulator
MIPLRWLAVASNLGFIVYGLAHPAPLMVALHAVLLPVNLWRVWQMIEPDTPRGRHGRRTSRWRSGCDPTCAANATSRAAWCLLWATSADRLYFVASGDVELPEVGRILGAGQMFGEIAFFAPTTGAAAAHAA